MERRLNLFDVLGRGLALTIRANPDRAARRVGIAAITELLWRAGRWSVAPRLNGDQTNQGRTPLLSPRRIRLYRVRLYRAPQ